MSQSQADSHNYIDLEPTITNKLDLEEQSHKDHEFPSSQAENEVKDDNDIDHDKPWMRRLKKFGNDSSFAASLYAFKSHSTTKRVFWGAFVFASVVGFCALTVLGIRLLSSKPIQTSITISTQQSLDFPTVTVCSLGYFNMTKLASLDRQLKFNFTTRLQELFNSIGQASPPNITKCKLIANDIYNSAAKFIQSDVGLAFSSLVGAAAGIDPNEFVQRCSFLGEDCKPNLTLVNTVDGVCFSFNGPNIEPPYNVRGTGVRQGLRLQLLSGNQIFSIEYARGYRVVIHDREEVPRPISNSVSIGTNSVLYIGMKKIGLIDNTKSGREPCRPNSRYDEAFFSIPNYPYYSVSQCQAQCLYQHLADTCNCVERGLYRTLRSPYKEMRNCSLLDLCCETETFESYTSSCNCLGQCDTIEYDLTVSNAVHSFEGMVGINVYYETLHLETQETQDSYTASRLLSDIGGNSGLFLGFTLVLLTVVEVAMLVGGLISDGGHACWHKIKKKGWEGRATRKESLNDSSV